jgi:hypothetical protein
MKVVKYLIDSTLPIEQFCYTQSLIYLDDNNIERVAYSGSLHQESHMKDMIVDDFIEMQKRLGKHNLVVIDDAGYDERISQYKAHCIKEEKLITKADFEWKLNCLPPQRWTNLNDIEVFHMKEEICFGLVSWLGRKGSRYFELVDEKSADFKTIKLRFEALASYSMGF